MKKILLAVFSLCALSFPVLAAEFVADAAQAGKVEVALTDLKKQQDNAATYPSTGASLKGSVDFSFTSRLEVVLVANPEYKNTLTSKKECRAVVIDKNWLLASKTCAVTDNIVTHNAYMGAGSAPSEDKYKVVDRDYSDFKITADKVAFSVDVFDIGDQFLIYASNAVLAEKLNKLPKANILITPDGKALEKYKNFNLFVRRDGRYGKDVTETVEVEKICTANACVKVENKTWHPNAAAGDPMFIVLDNKQEFLVAFNAAQNYSADYNRGLVYKTIAPSSSAKILEYVKKFTPASYKNVAKKIVTNIMVNEKSYSYK